MSLPLLLKHGAKASRDRTSRRFWPLRNTSYRVQQAMLLERQREDETELFGKASGAGTGIIYSPKVGAELPRRFRPRHPVIDGIVVRTVSGYTMKYPQRSPKADRADRSMALLKGRLGHVRRPKNRPSDLDND